METLNQNDPATEEVTRIFKDKKIMIGVPTGEMGRHATFWDYYNLMWKPEGTVCTLAHGQSPAAARNGMIEAALEHDCTHIMFIDDDMGLAPNTLAQLASHDLDIVSGYYVMRQYPHQGLIFDKAIESGECSWYEVRDDEHGLVECVATGLGCILFNLRVFENLEKPWIRLGEIQKDGWCDDIGLFKRIREAGFKIHIDLDVTPWHFAHLMVRPTKKDQKWHVELGTFTPQTIVMPMVRRTDGIPRSTEGYSGNK